MRIRPEEPADWAEITSIHTAAFGQPAEADLVRRLRDGGDLVLSLVADDGKLAGHIAFSRLGLDETPAVRGCALAPVAVEPSRQRQGIGSALIREGLKRLTEAGFDLVVVLGEPDYYGRFGFDAKLAGQIRTPYDGPYVQVLALSEKGRQARGPVSYARAFAELE